MNDCLNQERVCTPTRSNESAFKTGYIGQCGGNLLEQRVVGDFLRGRVGYGKIDDLV